MKKNNKNFAEIILGLMTLIINLALVLWIPFQEQQIEKIRKHKLTLEQKATAQDRQFSECQRLNDQVHISYSSLLLAQAVGQNSKDENKLKKLKEDYTISNEAFVSCKKELTDKRESDSNNMDDLHVLMDFEKSNKDINSQIQTSQKRQEYLIEQKQCHYFGLVIANAFVAFFVLLRLRK